MMEIKRNQNTNFKAQAKIEMGIYSLGENIENPITGIKIKDEERISNLIELAKLAEDLGLDSFHIGEAHQAHFISQSPLIILAAIASQTNKIILNTSASVISTIDPLRLYEDAVTLDLISKGRTELVIGKSARLKTYQSLGYSLDDYEEIFEEKFKLFIELNQREEITWEGNYRNPLIKHQVLPLPYGNKSSLRIWQAISGTLASAKQAARIGIPIYVSFIEQDIEYYQELINSYRLELQTYNYEPDEVPIGLAGLLYVSRDSEHLEKDLFPVMKGHYKNAFGENLSLENFSQFGIMNKPNYVGEVNQVIDKILYHYELIKMNRFIAQIDFGGLSQKDTIRLLETYATQIVPQVKKHIK